MVISLGGGGELGGGGLGGGGELGGGGDGGGGELGGGGPADIRRLRGTDLSSGQLILKKSCCGSHRQLALSLFR